MWSASRRPLRSAMAGGFLGLLRGWWRLWLCLSCSCQSIELACGCAQGPWLHACAKRAKIRIAAAPHICRTHRSAMFLAGHIRQTRGFTMLPESSICQTSYFAMWLASRMRQTLGFAMPPASDINQTPCCAIPVFSKPCLEDVAFCNASSKQHGSIYVTFATCNLLSWLIPQLSSCTAASRIASRFCWFALLAYLVIYLHGLDFGLARAPRRLARSTCSYNGLLSCSVCSFAKTLCSAKLASHIRERAQDCKLYPPNHTICDVPCESHSLSIAFRDVSCKQHLQDIRFCLGLCRSALVVRLMAFLALLFVLLPVSWRSVLSCSGCARPCTEMS